MSALPNKIMLVEDDDMFRTTLTKSLLRKKIEVIEASNGLVAQEKLQNTPVDLIISDIQMPNLNGVELLKWSKTHSKTPFILMTGFSQIIETQTAHKVGADDFLAKPFSEKDLLSLIEKYTSQTSLNSTVEPENLDHKFCKISIQDFISQRETTCEIYVRISPSKYIKIAHKGGKIADDRIKYYKEKGIHHVYVRKEDLSSLVGFNLKLAKLVHTNNEISEEKKINFLKYTSDLVLEEAFVKGVDEDAFRHASDFLETSMTFIAEDRQCFNILSILNQHADYIYSHSLGVSCFVVMMGKKLGWESPQTLFKLAMGGLFHDIGKKEIDRDVLEKPRALLTHQERNLFESHAQRGAEILESMGNIPAEIIQIAAQHHESCDGHGYPKGLSKLDIHPLAKLVQVASIFCDYTMKSKLNSTPVSAVEALHLMEQMKLEKMDHKAFSALKMLFERAS